MARGGGTIRLLGGRDYQVGGKEGENRRSGGRDLLVKVAMRRWRTILRGTGLEKGLQSSFRKGSHLRRSVRINTPIRYKLTSGNAAPFAILSTPSTSGLR